MRIYEALWTDDEEVDRHRSFHITPEGSYRALKLATTAFVQEQEEDASVFLRVPPLAQWVRDGEDSFWREAPMLGHSLHIIPHVLED